MAYTRYNRGRGRRSGMFSMVAKHNGWCERYADEGGPGCGGKVVQGETRISPNPNGGKFLHTACAKLVAANKTVPADEGWLDRQQKKVEEKVKLVKDENGEPKTLSRDCDMLPKFESMTLSSYQDTVIKQWLTSTRHLQIVAGPGCGKSFIIKYGTWAAKVVNGVYVVFNKAMKDEMADSGEIAPNVGVYTLHGLGRQAIQYHLPKGTRLGSPDSGKVRRLAEEVWATDRSVSKDTRKVNRAKVGLACRLVPHYKAQLKELPKDGLWLMSRFHISTNGASEYVEEVLDAIPNILARCLEEAEQGTIDFDDMIWVPIIKGWAPKWRELVMVDEAQDLTPAQLQLAMLTAGDRGRVIMVGDPLQAIYAWRGAALTGMEDAFDTLKQTARGCERLHLMETFRVPKSGVALCNLLYPQSTNPLLARDNAPDGSFFLVSEKDETWLDKLPHGRSLILSRTNAPAIRMALACLKRGQKAIVRGRDFATKLLSLIKQCRPYGSDDVLGLLTNLRVYLSEEKRKAEKRGLDCQDLEDRVACLEALSEGMSTCTALNTRIKSLFDDDTLDCVVFSTIHQAKGLEADYIVILTPEIMPGPWATQDWQREEERHICWVAWSRHKRALGFMDGHPFTGLPKGYQFSKLEDILASDPLMGDKDEEEPTKVEPLKPTKVGPMTIVPLPNVEKGGIVVNGKNNKVIVSIYTTMDSRGEDVGRNKGMDAIRHSRLGGGKATRTYRRRGWQYHVILKANKLITERAGKIKLPKLPTMKRTRDYVKPTNADWDTIVKAYEDVGVETHWEQKGYERVLVLGASY